MSTLLPISKQDLKLCAERWGWLCATRPDGSVYARKEFTQWWFDPLCEDSHNASAILDRMRVLLLNHVYGHITLYGDAVVWTCDGTSDYVAIPSEHIAASNFRSWLLVQLTLALPEEVWK